MEAPLHVIQIPRRFAPDAWGGTETLVLETSRALRQLGHAVEVFTTAALSGRAAEELSGVPVRRFAHFYPCFGLSAERRAALELKGGNPFSLALLHALLAAPGLDLVHLHTGQRLGGIGRWVARRRGIPYVVTLNGGVYDVPPAERDALAEHPPGALEWGKLLGWWVGSRRVLADASAIVCVGERELELVREHHPGRRAVYLPNGVDAERFARGDGAAFRRRHGLAPGERLLVCVGRIDPQKNQLQLVRALPRWRARVPGLRLVLVGQATHARYRGEVEAAARALGIADAVTLVGNVDPRSPDLVDAYHAADLFVLPSAHEPFGIAVLEAWAAGRAVVATRVGGLARLVRDGGDGLLVPPGDDDALADAVGRLLVDRDAAARLAREGTRRARTEFSWRCGAERLLELYREVIHAHPLRQ